MVAMTSDVNDVVHEGYIKLLALSGSFFDLFAVLFFLIVSPIVFDKDWKMLGFVILCVFPIILVSFLLVRRAKTTHVISFENSAQKELVATVDRTILNYRLIADYGQRPLFETRFAKAIGKYNTDLVAANKVLLNNQYFSPWISILFVAAYTFYGGLQVIDGALTLGMFLANLKIIQTMGSSWGAIYKVLMDIEAINPALMQVVELMNLPTDLPLRKALNRNKRRRSSEMRDEMRKTLERGWPVDNLPIALDGLTYDYNDAGKVNEGSKIEISIKMDPTSGMSLSNGPTFAMTGQVNLFQGEFTALVGTPGQGKSTLLRMLGGVILPTPGLLFVPVHLRVLHVATETLFFKASLFENLTFGCIPGDSDTEMERVVKICSRLGLPQGELDLIKQGKDAPAMVWGELLSHSHISLLGIARAIITNPELMCIHKPIMAHSEETSATIIAMLKEFCVEKGVGQDATTRHLRRPRTCVMTAAKLSSVTFADHVYLVSRRDGIRYVPK